MVEAPGVYLRFEPASTWSAEGPHASRILALLRRFAGSLPPQRVVVEQAAEEHVGLGTGTQLTLALCRGLTHLGRREWNLQQVARQAGRGKRSALGIHGFEHGGFLVEGGKSREEALSPLLTRIGFPPWPLLLIRPQPGAGLHGRGEGEVFAQAIDPGPTDALCRLVLLGLLPALIEKDVQAFGQALHEYNARAGEFYTSAQGGIYASPAIAEVIRFVRAQGVPGAGQSSWGPTVFAVVEDEDPARHLAERLREHFQLAPAEVLLTHGCNRGARLEPETDPSA
jgi:beta-ribofuranosylaminobenzene 5'-phosphate synthase